MDRRPDEIEAFKSDINLSAYAATQGYCIDERHSSKNAPLMKHPRTGDKIVLGKAADGHWTYFSVKNGPQDCGSIIDFIQQRQPGMNLGAVRVHLRPYLTGAAELPSEVAAYVRNIKPAVTDLDAIRGDLDGMDRVPFGQNAYLNQTRRLPPSLLANPALEGRILVDGRGNSVFPHSGLDSLPCGWESKNHNWTGFSPGGIKGLWWSRRQEGDNRLIIAESAIDALSWATLHGMQRTRLLSSGGSVNAQQPELISRAISKLPQGQVIIATDNDDGGTLLNEIVTAAYHASKRADLTLKLEQPSQKGCDWNDVLIATQSPNPKTPSL